MLPARSPAEIMAGPSPKKRGGACSGNRLGRFPSGDTLFGYCALRPLPTFGGQPHVNCGGSGVERIEVNLRGSGASVKWLVFPAHAAAPIDDMCHVVRGAQLQRRSRAEVARILRKLSYVHGASDVPLLGETIFQNLRRTAERFGDREALVVAHQGHRSTYAELIEQCEVIARGLMARGVRKGDRVGIWSPNRYEWVIVQYATAAIGAILVNINPAYRTSELEYALKQSGISMLILAAGFRQADYAAMLAEVKGRCPQLKEALVLEDGWAALQRDGEKVSSDQLRAVGADR